MPVTLLTYNIERGFHSQNHILEPERLQAAQRIVKQLNPDLITLTESCYAAPNSHNIILDYATLFNYPYSHIGTYPFFGPNKGDEGANCLLSRYPIHAHTFQLAYKSAIRASIKLEERILTLDIVHPSYSTTDEEKIKTLTPLLKTKQNPYIITGDFNTLHPKDQQDWQMIRNELEDFNKEKAEWLIQNWQNAALIPWLLKQGLQDALPEENRQSTVPTFKTYQKNSSGVRMDFAFISPEIKIKESYILKTSQTEIASDHYPLITTFEI